MTALTGIPLETAGSLTDRPDPTRANAEPAPKHERLEPEHMADHRARLVRAAYAMCGSREDAEDLVQETFERVLRRPRFIRPDHDLAYLLRVLRHTCGHAAAHDGAPANHAHAARGARVGGRRARRPAGGDGRSPGLCRDEDLSEPLRATIVAVDVVGLSYREAARSLRTPTGTIMSRLYRAREQVAAAMEAS